MSLKVTKLAKRYADRWILRDVSFEAQKGEITGVFGATGAGKTTLIQILSGAEKSNGGEIITESAFYLPKSERDSFWKNIFKSQKPAENALDEALERTEGILLLDETFCSIDSERSENYFTDLRRRTKEKNLTVLFATNDFTEIFAACDKVAVLAKGEIQQFDTPRNVYEKPANAEVARITGRNNLIRARRLSSTKIETPEFLTLDGKHRIFADKTEKHALGAINQNICLAIRPEHISISFGASFPEDNLLKATITEINFQGATTLIKLDANGLILCALVLRLVGLNVGDECVVGLPPDRILVLKD